MTKAEIKEIAKQVYKEEQDYQQLFKTMLDRSGKDINSMSDEEKKKFFTAVDKAYTAKSEGKLIDSKKKGKLNEDIFTGVLSLMFVVLIIKIVGIFFIKIATNVVDYFQSTSDNVKKENIANIFDKVSKNDKFLQDAGKLIDPKKGMDKTTANKIIKMSFIQSAIDVEIKDNNIDKKYKKDFEDSLIKTISNAWNNSSLMNNIATKVKNDIK